MKRPRLNPARLALLPAMLTTLPAALGLPAHAEPLAMQQARAAHQATPLPNGQVLLSGGCRGPHCEEVQASAELFDPQTGRFKAVAGMAEARAAHLALRLADGAVLVAGGFNGREASTRAERFDARTQAFAPVGPMQRPRMDGAAVRLPDGGALVIGGNAQTNQPVAEVERFDPRSQRFSTLGRLLEARAHTAAAALPDGQVLVVGGLVARQRATASVERFDPSRGVSERLPPLAAPRCKHAAVTLADGRVLVLGGSTNCEMRQRLASTELFDPATGRFSPGPQLQAPRYKIAQSATLLADGSVLIAGGADDVERWRPGEPAFQRVRSPSGPQGTAREFNTVTALADGSVLVAGGYDLDIRATAQAWRVTPVR